MGCSINSDRGAESDTGMGILASHAYGLLKVVHIDHKERLLQIRNPWGNVEWRGRWGADSKEMEDDQTQRDLGDSGSSNDGIFYMCLEDFVRFFEQIYVAFVPKVRHRKQSSFGNSWKKIGFYHTAGGCHENKTWHHNPQYVFAAKATSRPHRAYIGLSQIDLRYKLKKSPVERELQYESIGLTVWKTTTAAQRTWHLLGHKAYSTKKSDLEPVGRPVFMNMRDVAVEFMFESEEFYIIIPSTRENNREAHFVLSVHTDGESSVHELQDKYLADVANARGCCTDFCCSQ